jgi:hypothetical protein
LGTKWVFHISECSNQIRASLCQRDLSYKTRNLRASSSWWKGTCIKRIRYERFIWIGAIILLISADRVEFKLEAISYFVLIFLGRSQPQHWNNGICIHSIRFWDNHSTISWIKIDGSISLSYWWLKDQANCGHHQR